MTLDKAIAVLEALYRGGMPPSHPHPKEALRIGSEAIKAYKLARQEGRLSPDELLPGETKQD